MADGWKAVADALGERMAYHAMCAEDHRPAGSVEDCPFCADVRAYQRYQRKAGPAKRHPLDDAVSVPLHEIPLRDSAGSGE